MRRMFTKEQVSFKFKTNDIEHLSTDMINELNVGDMVVKGEHNYIVTYKGTTGICMTYHDASVVETVSYDLIDSVWTFNSKDIQSIVPYMDNIVDNSFNKRFVDFEGVLRSEVTGFTLQYAKASLSGTHLMLVISGTLLDESVIDNGTINVDFAIPDYILNKTTPIVGTTLQYRTEPAYASNFSYQSVGFRLLKDTNKLVIQNSSAFTLTATRVFRIQFDLLIDES